MAVKIERKYLQQDKYKYTWNRDKGDGEYAGKLDQIRVDKDEGYEVLFFIQSLMNKHGLNTIGDVKRIENALHSQSLSSTVMRKDLESEIESMLGLKA